MPAKPIPEYWERRIYEEWMNSEGEAGPYKLEALFEEEVNENESLPAPPVANTIRRYIKKASHMTQEERERYVSFSWPESMESGLLPWDASAAALELLRYRRMRGDGKRPTIRYCRWFVRVSQAAPERSTEDRVWFANKLELAEWLPPDQAERLRREVEEALTTDAEAPTQFELDAEAMPLVKGASIEDIGSTYAKGLAGRVDATIPSTSAREE